MFKRKPIKAAPRLVWRMSTEHPAGEFVSLDAAKALARGPASDEPAAWHQGSLRESSHELLQGVELSEPELTTLPGELIEELLSSRRPTGGR